MKKFLLFILSIFFALNMFAQRPFKIPTYLQIWSGLYKNSFINGTDSLNIQNNGLRWSIDATSNKGINFLDSVLIKGRRVFDTQDTGSTLATKKNVSVKMDMTDTSVVRTTGDLLYGNYTLNNSLFNIWTNSTAVNRGILSTQYSGDALGNKLFLQKARGTFASPTTLVKGDTIGQLIFKGYDGTTFYHGASITALTTGTISTNILATDLLFSTASSTASNTEIMRLKSIGLGIGCTPTNATKLEVGVINTPLTGYGTAVMILHKTAESDNLVLTSASGSTTNPSIQFRNRPFGGSDNQSVCQLSTSAIAGSYQQGHFIVNMATANNTFTKAFTVSTVASSPRIGIGNDYTATMPSYSLSFDRNAAQTVGIESTASTTDGKSLTITSGSTTGGGTNNLNGGDFIIGSGLGTGTGASNIIFKTPVVGTTGNTIHGALTERMRIDNAGNVAFGGHTTVSYLISLGGTVARTIGMERHYTANTAGNSLTITAGGATTGATNKNGGAFINKTAISTGSQGLSWYTIQTANAQTTGTLATTDNSTYYDRFMIPNTKNLVDGSNDTLFTCAFGSDSMLTFVIDYGITATDGTDRQAVAGQYKIAVAKKAGSIVGYQFTDVQAIHPTTGTLTPTLTLSGNDTIAVLVNYNSSLTIPNGSMKINYTITNIGGNHGTITFL